MSYYKCTKCESDDIVSYCAVCYFSLQDKIADMEIERAEIGECCTRFENSWHLNAEEVVRIPMLLETMASARHSAAGLEADGDYYRNLIDNTLMKVWGE